MIAHDRPLLMLGLYLFDLHNTATVSMPFFAVCCSQGASIAEIYLEEAKKYKDHCPKAALYYAFRALNYSTETVDCPVRQTIADLLSNPTGNKRFYCPMYAAHVLRTVKTTCTAPASSKQNSHKHRQAKQSTGGTTGT